MLRSIRREDLDDESSLVNKSLNNEALLSFFNQNLSYLNTSPTSEPSIEISALHNGNSPDQGGEGEKEEEAEHENEDEEGYTFKLFADSRTTDLISTKPIDDSTFQISHLNPIKTEAVIFHITPELLKEYKSSAISGVSVLDQSKLPCPGLRCEWRVMEGAHSTESKKLHSTMQKEEINRQKTDLLLQDGDRDKRKKKGKKGRIKLRKRVTEIKKRDYELDIAEKNKREEELKRDEKKRERAKLKKNKKRARDRLKTDADCNP